MKKLSLIAIVFLLFSLFLNGCKNFSEADNDCFEKKQNFSVVANCKQNKSDYKMRIEKNERETRFTYLSPEYVSGLNFLFQTETESASHAGLKIEKDSKTLFKSTTPAAISKAIQDYMLKPGEDIEGITEYGSYNVTIDKTSGLPKTLTLKEQNFSCEFE